VPRNLPLPNQPGAARHLAAMLKPLIEANDGRCFMLCTSHAMMRDLAEQFRATMTLPVLLQGETSKGSFAAVRQRRQCAAGGDQQLLGRGGRARRCAVAGDYR
jgi:ATP-dependent DNA helicase DinG